MLSFGPVLLYAPAPLHALYSPEYGEEVSSEVQMQVRA